MITKKFLGSVSYINRYTVTVFLFLIWISCIDGRYSWIKQYKLTKQLIEMEDEKKDVQEKLVIARAEYQELTENKEKYARERYYLRKTNEEVFIIK